MLKFIKNNLTLIFIFLQLSIPLKADFNNSVNTVKKEINRSDIKTAIKLLGEIKITNENEKERIDLLFGDIYLKINKPQKAIEFYERAFMTSDEDVESLSELGLAESYLRRGNLKESIKHAERSLEINSDRTRGKIVLAIGLTKNGEKEEALKILEQLFNANPNDSQVNIAIANYHSSFENNKEAINILDKFLKKFPTSFQVMDNLADLYWLDGNKEKALELKYKVFKYHEFNKNKDKQKETKKWISSIDPDFFKKEKKKKISKKKKKEYQEEEIEKYDNRKKEIEFEKFDFAYNFTGSGFIVGNGKYVITNNHVIDGAKRIAVRNGEGKISYAEVVAVSKDYDLAILKLNKKYKQYLKPKDFEDPKAGEDVLSIGYPMTLHFGNDLPVITQGIISKVYPDEAGVFLTTTDINAGNSGGPIFNLKGNLVGISVATLDKARAFEETGQIPTSMGIGIKSNMLKKVFKYKKTIPVKNVRFDKSKLYQNMLPVVVFIAVEADIKSKTKQ